MCPWSETDVSRVSNDSYSKKRAYLEEFLGLLVIFHGGKTLVGELDPKDELDVVQRCHVHE